MTVPTPAGGPYLAPICIGETRNRSFMTVPTPARTFFFSFNMCWGKYGVAHSGLSQHLVGFSSLALTCVGESWSRSVTSNSGSTRLFSFCDIYWGNLEPLIQDCPNNCGASLSLSGMCWGNAESLICECFKTCSAFFLAQRVLEKRGAACSGYGERHWKQFCTIFTGEGAVRGSQRHPTEALKHSGSYVSTHY
jgi:hypothetical protein